MTTDDEITARRVLRMEERLDQLAERVATTAPTVALDALAAMRADSAARFERIEGQVAAGFQETTRRFDRIEAGLTAIEQLLSSVAAKLDR
jgi:predicted transcriptional regulator